MTTERVKWYMEVLFSNSNMMTSIKNFCPIKIKFKITSFWPGIYLFKANNRNTKTKCEICSKLTINTPERRQWRRSGVFIVNFEHISDLALVFLLLTLSR